MADPKYQTGAKITSVTMLEKQLTKHDYFKHRDKTVPRGYILNMTYRKLRIAIENGEICLVKQTTK